MKLDSNVTVLGRDGQPLAEGLRAKELNEGTDVTITIELRGDPALLQKRDPAAGNDALVVTVIRLGKGGALESKASIGLKPLTEMTADDKYQGEDGGLYGSGSNQPPESHLTIARAETAKVGPLDSEGKPAEDGTIGLISISMSNATQEFSLFKQLADQDRRKSPRVTIVDCAQGGQGMARWANLQAGAWNEADRRLKTAKVSPNQVQVVWIKIANALPKGDLAEHGRKLQKDTLAVLQEGAFPEPTDRLLEQPHLRRMDHRAIEP